MADRPLADVCTRCDWTGAPENRRECPSCGSAVRIGNRMTPGALSHDFGGRERYRRSLPVYTERIHGDSPRPARRAAAPADQGSPRRSGATSPASGRQCGCGCSDNGARADMMAEVDHLRAAIAADRARAVTAAISPAVHELRNALPPVRHHAQRIEPGDRRDAILRGVDRALAVADELAAVLDGGPPPAGLTPDEARRLVEALHLDLLATADTVAALHGAIGTGLRNHCVAAADKLRLTADTARAALLRALGVEA